jgi:dihydrofolate synthase/folylpolyglutamate synthase
MATAAATTSLAGRWQRLGEKPFVVCDTGHNAHGFRYVAAQLAELLERHTALYCVIGFARDKEIDKVLQILPNKAHYIFTQAATPRALPADELAAKAAQAGLRGEVQPSVAEAMARARELASEEDAIFVGGSNYVVAEIL